MLVATTVLSLRNQDEWCCRGIEMVCVVDKLRWLVLLRNQDGWFHDDEGDDDDQLTRDLDAGDGVMVVAAAMMDRWSRFR
ncbi:hypothetical protein D8674_032238 [Pyrus ussuriensis x Pyrus communis]|uniref:Uncharacterized protein n=1 Tax=Pyrus ussuriensis x Pyrus communis TaxID=2448454 RepID=A0A5N5F0Y2_9ROSA|nr:hypothetical protein D8674_032238 [Pyrus ussuriensis x Pyrus communis]